jgi:arginine deiminase
MKLEFDYLQSAGASSVAAARASVFAEADPLTDVLLCRPDHLEAVPCCSVTRESVRNGFAACADEAIKQHHGVRNALERNGVRYRMVPARPGLADLCSLVTRPLRRRGACWASGRPCRIGGTRWIR